MSDIIGEKSHTYSVADGYYPLFEGKGESQKQARALQEGRNLVIAEVLDSMTPEGRDQLTALLDWFIEELKIENSRVRFSRGMALELLWEVLLFKDDPHRSHRSALLERYEAARMEAGDGYENPLAEWRAT